MKFRVIIFLLFLIVANNSNADNVIKPLAFDTIAMINVEMMQAKTDFFLVLENDSVLVNNKTNKIKFKRGKAILFTIFTGFLGGHRIYLGTHQRTPIIYSITLGGLGLLPLIDLIHIIFTKDLTKFEYKSQIIMWGR